MKKITILLFAVLAGAFAMQVSAQPSKGPARSNVYSSLPDGYEQLGSTSIYYDIAQRYANGPGNQYGVSIIGKIGDSYYSSTFEHEDEPSLFDWWPEPAPGAGFIAALQVNGEAATYVNALNGTTSNGVVLTTSLEPQGDVAARVIYTLTNNNDQAVTVNAGVWADIMIGTNDEAPLERLNTTSGYTYGIKMKSSAAANSPLLCVLFGEGVTGVTAVDDYWFGFFSSNWHANEIVGEYSSTIYNTVNYAGNTNTWPETNSQYYMVENGAYDSGLGFCWKERTIEPNESIELSYLISVGEYDFVEPVIPDDPEPGEDHFTFKVEAYDFDGWNDLSLAHPAHIYGEYEHPYGQEGYIEYQVDDSRAWTRIATPLVSGESYDLPFDMYFSESVTTAHTLEVRFNDGLDNCVALDTLTWIDVRSFPVTGLNTRVYNGQPQEYDVTVGDYPTITIGTEGEYVVPGVYTFPVEGDFDLNTINVNEVLFEIVKGQAEIEVVMPDASIDYDGQAHGATVTLVEGDNEFVVTYVNQETGAETTEAPIEPGVYEVIVEVNDTEYYNGIEATSYGEFEIVKLQAEIEVVMPDASIEYDGEAHGATVTLVKGDNEFVVTYVNQGTGEETTVAPTEPGVYVVIVEVYESEHYYGIDATSYGQFEIYTQSTAVKELNVDTQDGAWYTITGVRVAAPTERGIYIHNGKKYLVK